MNVCKCDVPDIAGDLFILIVSNRIYVRVLGFSAAVRLFKQAARNQLACALCLFVYFILCEFYIPFLQAINIIYLSSMATERKNLTISPFLPPPLPNLTTPCQQ